MQLALVTTFFCTPATARSVALTLTPSHGNELLFDTAPKEQELQVDKQTDRQTDRFAMMGKSCQLTTCACDSSSLSRCENYDYDDECDNDET